MATYRDVIFWGGATDGDCEATAIRARLLGMVIELGDDDKRPDKMTAFYEADGGGIIVYEVDCFEATNEWSPVGGALRRLKRRDAGMRRIWSGLSCSVR